MKHRWIQGPKAIIFLYDGVAVVQDKDAAVAASKRVRTDLGRGGLVENTENLIRYQLSV